MIKISIAIPYHGDRRKWTSHTVMNCHNLNFVKEIIITAEPKSETRKLAAAMLPYKKVRIYHNTENLFVFRNKVEAVRRCSGDWVALIDSDNIMGSIFLFSFLNTIHNNNVIYAPSFGEPMLRYEKYVGIDINLRKAAELIEEKAFVMLLNTMNYIFNRQAWLAALEDAIKSGYDPLTADSAWINYNCLKAGMVMRVLKGMTYKHTVHAESTFKLHAADGEREYAKIIKILRESRNENSSGAAGVHAEAKNTVSNSSNWSATGRSGRGVLSSGEGPDKTNLLTD